MSEISSIRLPLECYKSPSGLTLTPKQIESVERQLEFISKIGGVYNGSEQGTGKTCQTCVMLNILQPERAIFVVPPVVRYVWEEHIKDWCIPYYAKGTQVISSGKDKWDEQATVTIIGYSNLKKWIAKLVEKRWGFLCLDEAHYVKNVESQRTKYTLLKLWPKTDIQLALSGTAITNRALDIFSLATKFCPERFPRYYDFAEEFCYATNSPYGDGYMGFKNKERLNKLIYEKFYVRYLKKDIAPELPKKIYQKVLLPEKYAVKVPAEDAKAIKEETKKLFKALTKRGTVTTAQTSPNLQKYRREQGEKKVPGVMELVNLFLESGQSVVLFAYHRSVLTLYGEGLKKWKPQVIHGGIKDSDRRTAIDNFCSGKSNLFIGQINAAGVGITLLQKDKEAAPNVVLAELDYSPAAISQAIDRAHRIGVQSDVNVYYVTVKDSVDSKIMTTLMAKTRGIEKVIEKSV